MDTADELRRPRSDLQEVMMEEREEGARAESKRLRERDEEKRKDREEESSERGAPKGSGNLFCKPLLSQ